MPVLLAAIRRWFCPALRLRKRRSNGCAVLDFGFASPKARIRTSLNAHCTRSRHRRLSFTKAGTRTPGDGQEPHGARLTGNRNHRPHACIWVRKTSDIINSYTECTKAIAAKNSLTIAAPLRGSRRKGSGNSRALVRNVRAASAERTLKNFCEQLAAR